MSTTTGSTHDSTQRPIDRWFAHYSGDHRNATNQLIHVICVPAILWVASNVHGVCACHIHLP